MSGNVTIKTATLGIDQKGVKRYLDKIKDEALNKAGRSIENSADDFKKEIHKVWVGEAADEFGEEVERTGDILKKKLKKLYNEMQDTFDDYLKNWEKFDKNQHTDTIGK